MSKQKEYCINESVQLKRCGIGRLTDQKEDIVSRYILSQSFLYHWSLSIDISKLSLPAPRNSMAQFVTVFQFIIILHLCLVLKSAYVDSTEFPCSFPPGSIACKAWNHTNMDCSRRELVCIPQLRNNASLESLDLSNNELTVLPADAFSGFIALRTLDLSSNKFSKINGDAFSRLRSLLSLDLSDNAISSINGTFIGLSKLNTLDLSAYPSGPRHLSFTSDSPFQYLLSLQTLFLDESYVTVTPATFTGLNHTLQVLYISIDDMTTDTPFVQLSSLQHLGLKILTCSHVNENLFVGLDKLKYLELDKEPSHRLGCIIDFSPLVSLTNFRYYFDDTADSIDSKVQTLISLNSPLQTVELYTNSPNARVNSSTFESLPKWKESLQELTLNCRIIRGNIQIEGSPFQWFPQLQRLHILDQATTASWTYPENTFKGLANLKEVHLNNLNIGDYIATRVLNTSVMHSLKVLDLSINDIGHITPLYKICDLKTLETIDLSDSTIDRFVGIDFVILFSNKPNLTTLNVDYLWWFLYESIKFRNLVHFFSSNCYVDISPNITTIHAPLLQEFRVREIKLRYVQFKNIYFPAMKVLRIFDAPQLKILDFSSNQIIWIDEENAPILSNVTYLDLSDNQLTSLSNLTNLCNIKVLLLGGNLLTTVPILLLSNNPLQILDLHDNMLVCGCSIVGLQKWMLTDDVAYVWNNESDRQRYKCVGPEVGPESRYSITEINLDCDIPLLMYISVSVTGGLVTIFAAILAVRYRWHIQYRLFLLFKRRAYQNYLINDDDADDDFEDEGGVPRYDAYVIYHDEDEDWVTEQLLANIEEDHEEQFKLCLKDRDMRAGRSIFNELSLHIQRSRKTLVVLTPRFVDDNWCYFQLNMAHHRVLEESHNVLIFVILEEIPDNRLTLLLRQLFCKSQCLKWPNDNYGQNLFWRRLREELKRPVPRDLIHRYRRYNIWKISPTSLVLKFIRVFKGEKIRFFPI